MITPDILPILRCPASGEQLILAEPSLVEEVNAAIGRGDVRDTLDQAVNEPIDGGLMIADGSRIYPIRNGIPTLIIEDALCWPASKSNPND
ncbi:MAG: Trm112 family protein [Planctomycetota bacterium]